jgi:hypothetical protein
LPAAAAATLLGLAIVSEVAPTTVYECLLLVGLEQIATDLRLNGVAGPVNVPGKPAHPSAPIGL